MSAVLPVPPHRAIRAALFAVVCVGVAALLHGMADGCQVSWTGIGLGLPPIWLVACAGLGRERSGPTLTIGLGAAQVGLHYLFAHLCAVAAAAATTASTTTVSTTTVSTTTMVTLSMPDMPNMPMPQSANQDVRTIGMFAAHALAVVICGWWLRQGERDFFALCRAVAALVAAPLHRLTDAIAALSGLARVEGYDVPRIVYALPFDGLRHRRTPLLTSVTFRGPPVFA
jgi:hypothetical protein